MLPNATMVANRAIAATIAILAARMTSIVSPGDVSSVGFAHDLFRKPVPTFRDHALLVLEQRHRLVRQHAPGDGDRGKFGGRSDVRARRHDLVDAGGELR